MDEQLYKQQTTTAIAKLVTTARKKKLPLKSICINFDSPNIYGNIYLNVILQRINKYMLAAEFFYVLHFASH